jgi:DNA polymerase III sliding clamp (beta) subunit (PCNA family)
VNIAAADLKRLLKKLSPVKAETYRFDTNGIVAQDSDVIAAVQGLSFGGTFNINGKNLSRVVSKTSGQINIEQQSNKLILTWAKAKVELEIQPVKSVALPEATGTPLALNLPDLKKALNLTVPSASTAKSAAFGGVVQLQSLPVGLETEEIPGYRVVGTDAIVITAAQVLKPVQFEFKSLLNLTAAAIVQIMDGETVSIQDTAKYLVLKAGDTTVYASKPVQKYPDGMIATLLAMPTETKFGFKTEEWLNALRTAELLIDEEKDKGAISLHLSENVVQFKNTGVGSTATDEAGYEQIYPDPIFDPKEARLKLTAKYLSGFLSRAGTEATFGITERPIRLESDGVVVLTMPFGGKK